MYIGTGMAYRDQGRALREDDPLDTSTRGRRQQGGVGPAGPLVEFGVPLTILLLFSFTGIADDGSRLFPALLRAAPERQPMTVPSATRCAIIARFRTLRRACSASPFRAATGSPPRLTEFNLGQRRHDAAQAVDRARALTGRACLTEFWRPRLRAALRSQFQVGVGGCGAGADAAGLAPAGQLRVRCGNRRGIPSRR